MGVRDAISAAMRDQQTSEDCVRAATLRLVQCAIRDRDIAAHAADRTNGCEETEITDILKKMVRQRVESARDYEDTGRLDLADREREEIAIIESFLPPQLSEPETRAAVEGVVDELSASGLKDFGRVMGALKQRYSGRMDVGRAGDIAKAILA